jgi:hypothetical protein
MTSAAMCGSNIGVLPLLSVEECAARGWTGPAALAEEPLFPISKLLSRMQVRGRGMTWEDH